MKRLITVTFICLGLLTGCNKDKGAAVNKPEGVRKEISRGPVDVVVETDRKQLSIADRLNLTITVNAEEDYKVELPPPIDNKLAKFGIVDFSTSQPKLLDDGRVQIKRKYILEPFLSGEYVIPPLKILFWKKDAHDGKKSSVETEKIKILVTSVLPDDLKDFKVHEIVGPVRLPRSYKALIWVLPILIIIILVIGALLIRRRRYLKEQAEKIPALPPHEKALRALDALRNEKLVERGEIKKFYQKVSLILRVYIEDRFGLRAPEQTTEEFMETLRETNALPVKYQSLLEDFLTHCDMVKFAELQPNDIEIKKTFESCRAFIVGTIERDTDEGQEG